MKAITYTLIFVMGSILFTSCEEYLDKTPDADVSNEDIFGTYESFQGFFDANYGEVIDYITVYPTTSHNFGGETLQNFIAWSESARTWIGDYWYIAGMDDHSFNDHTSLYANVDYGTYGKFMKGGGGGGIWTGGWRGIRVCNVALDNLHLLSDATAEEKQLIEGQIYFFRAFFHHQIIDAFGGMPYVDKTLSQSSEDDLRLDRLTYHECAEKIVEDYDRAIPLLPLNWDETEVGAQRPGTNDGRATKGAAMAYKAKILLYAGSPLMNKFSGNDYSYNKEYCERSAAAGWDLIQLVNNTGIYELSSFDEMDNMFARKDDMNPWTKETIFQRMNVDWYTGGGLYRGMVGKKWSFARMGGKYCEQVNQLYVDKFEMADGTRYKEEYDNDNARRWDDRDPRFRKWIIVDRDQHGYDDRSVILLYEGEGSDRSSASKILLPYLIKKFWPVGVNGYDQDWNGFLMASPKMRYAEVLLNYAEAVTVAYGATGSAPGASLSAVNAVNMIRARAGMPDATAAAPEYPSFLEFLWNERTVELAFEGHYWFDTRRWYIAHKSLECVNLSFDKDWTTFTRSVVKTRVFQDPKHYWFPINRDQTLLYPGMYQNPGWD